MVLEGLVTNVLNRVLGMYVHNFDPKQLQIGIFSGQVDLKNLELRKEALDQLKLPLNVVEGHVGSITLNIPFSNLRGQPVKVNVQDVFILASPREDADYDAAEDDRRTHNMKMEKLESAELLKERNTEGMSKEEQQKQQSFTASLTTAIIDNLQITVKNIHVRYEDSISDPGHPFAAGLTLKELSAQSTDENWQPKWIAATSGSSHKLAKLGSLAVYWDTDCQLLGTGKAQSDQDKPSMTHDELLNKFKQMTIDENNEATTKHQFILKPISGQAGLEMDKTGKSNVPKMKARVFFDELGFMLDEDQYRDALMLIDLFHYFIRHQQYKRLQPKMSPKEDPRAWFKFAGQAVLDKIHERNRRWSPEFFAERRKDRLRYVDLFKKKKREEKLVADEASDLDSLEHKLSYEDLRFWRSLARNQMRKENVGAKKAPQKQTWTQWMLGQKPESADDTQISEEEREKLYAAIDFDEKKAITESVDLPKETVKLQLGVHLQRGSFTLRRRPHANHTDPLRLLFDGLSLGYVQRPESLLANLTLHGINLYDETTDGNLFPQMIKVKDATEDLGSHRITNLDEPDSMQHAMQMTDQAVEKPSDDSFFSLSYEKNPLDGHADSVVGMRLQSMEVIYNPNFIAEISRFFKPPERHMESIGALMDQAGEAVEGIRKQTRAGLEFALEEHKTIDLKLDLQAPLIIIPDSVTRQSTICLILDAGHISMTSQLVDKDKLKEVQAKQKQIYSDNDYKQLEGLLYDKFLLKLDSTQMLIGPSIESTKSQLTERDDKKNYHIVERINMDFLLETCIIAKGSDLTKLRITGKLPVLHATISDAKYKSLMKLLDVAIPKSDSEQITGSAPSQERKRRSVADVSLSKTESKSINQTMAARRKSFQFSALEHELVMEEDGDEEAGKSQTFMDAQQGHDSSQTSMHQRSFEFNFVVEKLQGSLYKSDASGREADHLLAEMVAEGFALAFYQRKFDMTAEVTLKTLVLEDHVEQSPSAEFKNIVSSGDQSAGTGQNLFKIKFVRVNRESPEFQSKFEGIGTNLDVAVSTINLIVTRKTLLTLLDFVLVTFAGGDNGEHPNHSEQLRDTEGASANDASATTDQKPSQDRIRIKAELQAISMILNNDGIRLATLSLNTASIGLTLMGKTMRLGARLGNLSLVDDVNEGASEESSLRQLLTIEGDQLADFSYETFDEASDAYPGHDSSIKLRSGSLKVNFVTEPFRKIMEFGVKFGKMQAIFNAARQAAANQAEQMTQRASKMHFDILIKTPIIVFPQLVAGDEPARNLLTANLGELYANNKFVPIDDSGKSTIANELSAGIRNTRLTSLLHYGKGKSEELELIDKVDLNIDVSYLEHQQGFKRPDLEVRGSLSDIKLRLAAQQLQLVMALTKSIPAAFSLDSDDAIDADLAKQLPRSTTDAAKDKQLPAGESKETVKSTHMGPELGKDPEKWTKVDLVFKIGAVGLELLQSHENQPIGDIKAASLSQFSLNKTHIKLRMMSDGSMESELLIQSFTVQDTRQKEANKYRNVMSLINSEITQQFMANITMSGGEERNLMAILTIDSPRVILALDYLFSVQAFVNAGLATEENDDELQKIQDVEEEDDEASSNHTRSVMPSSQTTKDSPVQQENNQSQPTMTIAFRANVVDAQIVLLANPAISSSEAIVLGVKQAVVAKQHATTLQVEKVGMFLCRMDKFDSTRLRILDDFSIVLSLDIRSQMQNSSLTNISVDIEPMVLRLSLRDILLASQIFTKASSMGGSNGEQSSSGSEKPSRIKEIESGTKRGAQSSRKTSTRMAHSIKTKKTAIPARKDDNASVETGSTIMKREEMSVHVGGIRVVLIGDLHELPIFDFSVREFEAHVRDWSAQMNTELNMDMFINVYNFSKSAWEPLIEPWSLGFHMSKEQNPDKLVLDLYSRKALEVTLTSATIALFSKSAQFLSASEDILSKPRKADAPYRVRNYTGFVMDIWSQDQHGQDGNAKKLEDGAEEEWRFEDPSTMRETLAPEGTSGVVGIKLEGSGFDSVEKIAVNKEGEVIYPLNPRKDRVLHRLLVEIKLGADNVKYITFRSPLVVENNTQLPIELGVYAHGEGNLLRIENIAPGESRPAPVGAAYMHSLVFRPAQGFGYEWSNERIFWKDLLKQQTRTIACKSQENGPPFYYQMHAVVNKTDPLSLVYPYMKVRLTPPVEIQNLLPFDFKYKIYDKNTKRDWSNFLRRGGVSPGHVVNLSHLLLISVDVQDTPFKQSDFAIINSPDRDFSREKTIVVKDKNDVSLRLKLHYFNIPDSGGAFKVSVYCPYIILNRTELPLDLRSKTTFSAARAAAGMGMTHAEEGGKTAKPQMFSFPSDDQKNRALIRLADSAWSKPQSFNAIGSEYSVQIPAKEGRAEMPVGVHVSQGDGKYNLTNVITIAPRFVVKSRLPEDVFVREPGSSETTTLKPNETFALKFIRQTSNQQLSLCWPGLNNQWSAPFFISNVGRVHVKLAKEKQKQQLLKVEILMEEATIFINLSITQYWPFSIRNESDTEFFFYQANPNVDEDDEDRNSTWRPVRYKLPPRSLMPYAWDYPASKNKDLILDVQGRRRNVKLAEIGQQIPLKLGASADGQQKTIDIDVVADGPNQTLVLSNWKPSLSLYRQKTNASTKSTSTAGFEVKDMDTDVTMKATLRFAGIGISLINRNLRELLYCTFREIELKYTESALYQTVNWTTKWVQIDNQLYGGIFPILIYPSVVPKTGKEMEAHPIFHMALTRVKDDSYGVIYIKYFTILLQQLTVEVDEDFIFALLDFTKIPGASWSPDADYEGKLCDEEVSLPEPQREESGQDIYFELLHLQPMQIDLSFVRTERINAEDTMAVNNPFMFAVNVLTMSLGNVNDAPLRYNALMLENARIAPSALITNMQNHYVQESLRQVHIVLGSADFLGNPVGLFNNVSSGVADIFYEPYQGLVMSDRPQDLGLGIAKGASSFVKKSVFGLSDSMAKVTGSISKGLAAASLDKEFQDARRMSRSRNRPKHALYGITSGGNAFAESIASGIGGLARHPLEGAEKEGFGGFMKGVGKGVLGLATKPAIGAFDLASNLAEGVRNTTTVFDQEGLDRVRLTRFIGQDGIVRPYEQRDALGQFWLKTLDNGKYFSENYIAHLELQGKELLVILTYNAIMLVRSKKLSTEWNVPLKDIQRISKERTGMNISLKEGRNGPFIPIQDEGSRNWFYKQIAIAVNSYNEKWQART